MQYTHKAIDNRKEKIELNFVIEKGSLFSTLSEVYSSAFLGGFSNFNMDLFLEFIQRNKSSKELDHDKEEPPCLSMYIHAELVKEREYKALFEKFYNKGVEDSKSYDLEKVKDVFKLLETICNSKEFHSFANEAIDEFLNEFIIKGG